MPNTITLLLNSSKQTSYKLLGLVSLYLSLKNPVVFIELFKKTNFSELSLKTLNSIQNFLFITSKLPYKTLQLNILEAKDLLRTTKILKFHHSAYIKPVLPSECIQSRQLKKLQTDLYEIRENSESMEYSPTQELSSKINSKNK
jgi:hypothetical protein